MQKRSIWMALGVGILFLGLLAAQESSSVSKVKGTIKSISEDKIVINDGNKDIDIKVSPEFIEENFLIEGEEITILVEEKEGILEGKDIVIEEVTEPEKEEEEAVPIQENTVEEIEE